MASLLCPVNSAEILNVAWQCAVCMATFQQSKAKVLLEHALKHVGTKKAPGKTAAECFPGVDLTLD